MQISCWLYDQAIEPTTKYLLKSGILCFVRSDVPDLVESIHVLSYAEEKWPWTEAIWYWARLGPRNLIHLVHHLIANRQRIVPLCPQKKEVPLSSMELCPGKCVQDFSLNVKRSLALFHQQEISAEGWCTMEIERSKLTPTQRFPVALEYTHWGAAGCCLWPLLMVFLGTAILDRVISCEVWVLTSWIVWDLTWSMMAALNWTGKKKPWGRQDMISLEPLSNSNINVFRNISNVSRSKTMCMSISLHAAENPSIDAFVHLPFTKRFASFKGPELQSYGRSWSQPAVSSVWTAVLLPREGGKSPTA